MTEKHSSLVINPDSEITFKGPFKRVVLSYLELTNVHNDKVVLFKIKTTAPKKYCVRPNCGAIAPSETIKVMIALQPFEFDQLEKARHKFMVQSLLIEPKLDRYQVEQEFHEADPATMFESKLRCIFEVDPDDQQASATTAAVATGAASAAGGGGAAAANVKMSASMVSNSSATTAATGGKANSSGEADSDGWASKDAKDGSEHATGEPGGHHHHHHSSGEDHYKEKANELHRENLLLNEQILRLKRTIESAQSGKEAAATTLGNQATFLKSNNPYSPPMPTQAQLQQQKIMMIVAGFVIAILGMIIGKYAA